MDLQTLLHLNAIEGIGPVIIARLTKTFSDASRLYAAGSPELVREFGCAPAVAEKIVDGLSDKALLEQELTLIDRHGIKVVSLLDEAYPPLLREITAPPPILYYRGELPPTAQRLSLVGARKADGYGRHVVTALVPDLVSLGWHTVSGGALGIDSMVHQETLKAGGTTVVVLGSGLLSLYPPSNRSLFESVAQEGGAVVSSFPVQFPPKAGNFPARNRIISGLSRGCVVVQAAAKSGALITAHYALEQGRDVFAVPGRLGDPLSEGCNALIQQGAKLIRSVDDIVEEYGQRIATSLVETPVETAEPSIVSYCAVPRSADELSQLMNIELADLYVKLFELQVEGKIRQNMAGLFEVA